MDAFFPDFVEVGLSIFSGFKFKLPVTAMGIDDPMIVEIVAEYGQSASNPEMFKYYLVLYIHFLWVRIK